MSEHKIRQQHNLSRNSQKHNGVTTHFQNKFPYVGEICPITTTFLVNLAGSSSPHQLILSHNVIVYVSISIFLSFSLFVLCIFIHLKYKTTEGQQPQCCHRVVVTDRAVLHRQHRGPTTEGQQPQCCHRVVVTDRAVLHRQHLLSLFLRS